MNCLDCEEKLSDYIEHALGPDNRSLVELHLKECSACADTLATMSMVIVAGRSFPEYEPPPWLASRIVANTPQIRRDSIRSILGAAWQSIGEPRTALAIFTAAIVMGWLGSVTVREAIIDRAESVLSCAYDHAVRSYYRSPMIIEIHSEIQSRLDQLTENS